MKAFEKVPYVHIIRAAIKHGYCLWTLRLSIQAYLSPRMITIDGICSRLIYAARGMTAGSGFATSEMRCLFIDVCDAAYALCPSITLTLYVDDLAIEACGSASFVVSELTKATDFVTATLEDELQLEVSTKKSVTVGSNPMIAQRVASAL